MKVLLMQNFQTAATVLTHRLPYSAKPHSRILPQRGIGMTKHVILWQLKDELSAEQKAEVKKQIKAGLEGLVGKVPGLLEVHVHIDGLASSNADLMLDTTLESPEALKGYAVHPAHLAVANGVVRPNTKNRVCFDFEI